MNVLVTGGAGFIGSHLADRLVERGDTVTIVDSFDPFYNETIKRRNIAPVLLSGHAKLLEIDITDENELDAALGESAFDGIVHLAARAGVRPSIERPMEYVRTNIDGTQSMLNIALRRGVRPIVFGSSSSVYGDSTPVPFSETAAVASPISPYAATKRAAELLCHAHAHLHSASIACLRLFTVYGPRQRPDLAIHKFARLMSEGRAIPFFGDGTTERDYTYIADIISGIERSLDWAVGAEPGAFEIINLGESVTTTLARLVEMIGAELGTEPVLQRMSHQAGDVQKTFADVTHARELLGYDPRTTMEEGIRRFVEWFRA
ncbi:MAG: SDR family NAD(P)-dependent oxidoreductase, partial [Gemmatimonadaceae bacterium]